MRTRGPGSELCPPGVRSVPVTLVQGPGNTGVVY